MGATPCGIGYWAAGYDNAPCTKCGAGLTTAAVQSVRPTDCVAQAGWQKKNANDAFADPCPVGSYSQGGADAKCQKCSLGSSTQYSSAFSASQCSVCAPGWGYDTHSKQCVICTPGFFSTGGSDEACTSCGPGKTSTVAATSSGDCFDEMVSTMPYDFIETPESAWTVLDLGSPANATSAALQCRNACQADDLCQYWLYLAAQADPSHDGCKVKRAPAESASDTYTSLKLATGDYAVWPAGVDEYGMRAQPWTPADGSTVDPWSCLRGCDKESSCLAVFTTKLNETWACWMIDGGIGLGLTTGGVKVAPTQINAYFWAWTTLPTNTPGVSRLGCVIKLGALWLGM